MKGSKRCNNFPFTPVFETGGAEALHPAGGLAPDPQLLPPLPSDPGDATVKTILCVSTDELIQMKGDLLSAVGQSL